MRRRSVTNVEDKAWRMFRAIAGRSGGAALGTLIVAVITTTGTGCSNGYKEKVIPAKEFSPQDRAKKMLEGYAAGGPVGSEFMGFELLREELRFKKADPTGVLCDALTQIEKAMRNPAEVKAIAQRTLAALDTPAAPQQP
jgi:hypothetical protein